VRRLLSSGAAVALAAFLLAGARPAPAQDNQDSKDALIQQLLSRVEALEREVALLKHSPAAESPETAIAPASPAAERTTAAGDSEPAESGRFNFKGYADVSFLRNDTGDSTKRFALGEIDLFATERISDHVTALMETVLETDAQQTVGVVPVNVERLLLQYRGNDFFNLDMGSYRTAIGYYSTAYLRGSWLQTALSRPKMFLDEDDGGPLPLHNTGLSANGGIPSGGLGLHYIVEVGSSRNYGDNGRTAINFSQNEALNVAVYARPPSIPGLEAGFSGYRDSFSPEQGAFLNRSVWTAHVVYQANRIEFLNEGVLTNFRDRSGGHASVPAFYSQLAYGIGRNWRPYFRYEYMNSNGTGSESVAHRYIPWRTVTLGGVRYDITDSVALKFELGRETNWLVSPWIRAAAQVAFTF